MKLRSLTLCLFILALSFTAGAREKSGGEGEGLQKSAIIGEIKRIAVNRINLPLENNGDVGQSGASWFPNGQESLSFLFAGGPAMSGYVNGDLRTAWMASASRQYETQPGRTGSAPDDPLAKFYIVDNRKDSFGSAAYVDWANAVALGADYQDLDGNGSYDPNTDRPDILGDYTMWCVYNDGTPASARTELGTLPMGIDVLQTVWAFERSDPLGNVVFIRYRIVNANPSTDIDDFIFTAWVDPDLGDHLDDLIGCDIEPSLGYIYNDGDDNQYGSSPPAFGIDFFQGPIVESPGDTAYLARGPYFGVEAVPHYRNLPLTSFMYYIQSDPTLGDPANAQEARNYQEGGIDRLGDPVDPSLYGTGGEATSDSNYFYNGDPVAGTGWLDTRPTDKRFMMNTGPFQLAAGDTQDVVVAYIVSRGANALNSLSTLRTHDILAQAAYDNNFLAAPPLPPVNAYVEEKNNAVEFTIDLRAQREYGLQQDIVGQVGWEGIQIYQVRTDDFDSETVNGFDNIRLLATYDLNNEFGNLYVDTDQGRVLVSNGFGNLDSSDVYGVEFPTLRFTVTEDAFTGEPLINYTSYNFAIVPYGLNVDLATLNENTTTADDYVLPGGIFGKPLQTGRFTVMPGGSENVPFGSSEASRVAGISEGRLSVEVLDPDAVKGDTYQVSFFGNGNYWKIDNQTTGTNVLDSLTFQAVDQNTVSFPVVDGVAFQLYDVADSLKSVAVTADSVWLQGNKLSGFGDSLLFNWGFDLAVYAQNNPSIERVGINVNTQKQDYFPVRLVVDTAPSAATQAYYYTRNQQLFLANFYGGLVNSTVSAFDMSDPNNPRQLNILYNALNGELLFTPGNTNLIMVMNTDYNTGDVYNPNGGREFREDVYMVANLELATGAGLGASQMIFDVTPSRPNNDEVVYEVATADLLPVQSEEEKQDMLGMVNIVPNPYYAYSAYEESYDAPVLKFTHLSGPATIRIFNLAGQLVKTIEKTDSAVETSWDLRNEVGLRIASGMYIAHIEVRGVGEKVLKFGVIQREDRIDRF
ncbi:MAG: T9SS type A sorting domain-containing protein [Calditrichaeota bacterium]|nr:T9SS type A sorting domain-containing protein [Calditrichota bacterium]HQU71072.1 T9SS type A sorting domain-containing protein [Calditrichia bacterium]